MDTIKISRDLELPLDFASRTVTIFGLRGAGKTNTAGVLAEELLRNNQQIAVLDPTDAWWGLRAGRDGHADGGYPIVIIGGSHGDIPLQESDGKTIAEFVVQEHVSVVLSLRHLRKAGQRRFVTAFCEELYHLKGHAEQRTALTVFIDEAPLFIPQKVMGDVAATVGAVEDLIARGRLSGFGVVLISQRSATLNADVRTQSEVIICHRVTSHLDRNAIADWFEENASVEQLREILQSLATLRDGEAWIWAPTAGIMRRARILLRRTFDSSATPKIGETAKLVKAIREIDLTAIRTKLASTIERARADDPAELRKQIKVLEKQLANVQVKIETREVSAFTDFDRALMETVSASCKVITRDIECLGTIARDLHAVCEKALTGTVPKPPLPRPPSVARPVVNGIATFIGADVGSLVRPQSGKVPDLARCERAIVSVLASHRTGCTAARLTLLSGYRYSGGFKNALTRLRTAGYITGGNSEVMCITEAGLALGIAENIPTYHEDLAAYWLNHKSFAACERAILSTLLQHREGLTKEKICQLTGYQYSGGFKNALTRLRTAGVLIGGNGDVMRAHEDLI